MVSISSLLLKSGKMIAMQYELISFDLQGTLSDAAFSKEAWSILLPQLYAKKRGIALEKAGEELRSHFQQVGRYDRSYYTFDDWLQPFDTTADCRDYFKKLQSTPS